MSETEKLAKAIRYMLMLFFILMFIEMFTPIWWLAPGDDTDSNDERSGMTLLIDYGTGCQYLSRFGGITPRLDRDGQHVCDGGQGDG